MPWWGAVPDSKLPVDRAFLALLRFRACQRDLKSGACPFLVDSLQVAQKKDLFQVPHGVLVRRTRPSRVTAKQSPASVRERRRDAGQ